jgi:hypothetical protein
MRGRLDISFSTSSAKPARFSRDQVFEFDTEDLRLLRDGRPQLCNSILPHLHHALRHSFLEVIEF